MANDCYFNMKIIGTKKHIDMFYAQIPAYTDKSLTTGGQYFNVGDDEVVVAYIDGDCRRSILSSMIAPEPHFLLKITQELDLKIEVFSAEAGMGFQEHYIIDRSKTIVEECVDWETYCLGEFETKEQAEKELDTTITDEEWDNKIICRGGFSWDFTI